MMTTSDELNEKLGRLRERLKSLGPLAVAFSGGVDSSLLLWVAHETFGDRMMALIAAAQMFPHRETQAAAALCEERAIPFEIVPFDALALEGFRRNPPDRCYHCKRALFSHLIQVARERGFEVLTEGSNADDVGDYRPGLKAIAELGVVSPLRDAGLRKADVRALAAAFGLPTAAKPSSACLASRVAYDLPLDAELLNRIERAEDFLHDEGFEQVRVRVHGDVARIETPPDAIERLAREPLRSRVTAFLRDEGFGYITLDLEGYRTGSLNEGLA